MKKKSFQRILFNNLINFIRKEEYSFPPLVKEKIRFLSLLIMFLFRCYFYIKITRSTPANLKIREVNFKL